MKVSIHEANQLVGEIIRELKQKRGVKFDDLWDHHDHHDIVLFVARRDGYVWDTCRQEWIKGDSK